MFDNIIGHNSSKEVLLKDIEKNKVSHAYAFIGPSGIGKKKLAEEFAKKILNEKDLSIAIDYKYISKLENKKNIIIEQIRKEIVEDVYIAPATGSYKVYIIDDAENLNEESQNALLKTLEEPPNYVCIILIAENIQNFLPTIISRVKQIRFNKLSDKEITEYILLKDYDKDYFTHSMLSYIDGSIGKLVKLTEESEYNLFKDVELIVENINLKRELEVIKLMDKISFKNTNALNYLEYLLYYSNKYSYVFEIEEARKKLKYNGNEDIIKTVLAIKLCRKEKQYGK